MSKTTKNGAVNSTKNGIPTMVQVCLDRMGELKEMRATLAAQKEQLKAEKQDLKDVNAMLKTVNDEIKQVMILCDLASQKPLASTHDLFKYTARQYEIGKFYEFNLDVALLNLTDFDADNYVEELQVMGDNLGIISTVLSYIGDSKIYDTIGNNLLPQYVNNEAKINYSQIKKDLCQLGNCTMFNDVKVTFDAPSAKVIGLCIVPKVIVNKKIQSFTVDMSKFGRFATMLQQVIIARVAKTELSIAQNK